jgi:hypothetical protein
MIRTLPPQVGLRKYSSPSNGDNQELATGRSWPEVDVCHSHAEWQLHVDCCQGCFSIGLLVSEAV